jgi:hypothetical protein
MRQIRPIIVATALAVLLATSSTIVSAQRVPPATGRAAKYIFESALKLVGVVSAAKVAQEAGISVHDYWQGTAPPGQSIYSATFQFNKTSWADFWTGPDIYMVVESEGGRSVLIPEIENNWNGQEKIYTFRCLTMLTGSRCVLRLYDDDNTSNAIWNSILSTRVRFHAGTTVKIETGIPRIGHKLPTSGVQSLEAAMQADGTFQILDTSNGKQYQIDKPDAVATANFTVPSAGAADRWQMEGEFVKDGTTMGKVSLTHWYTNNSLTVFSHITPNFLFWAVLAVGAFAALCWKQTRPQAV